MAETKTLNVRFQQKFDTAANWAKSTIVLLAGEMAIESDTGKFKFGDGKKTYAELSYVGITQRIVNKLTVNNFNILTGR